MAKTLFRLPPSLQRRLAGGAPVVVDGLTLAPEVQLALALRVRMKARGLSEGSVDAARRRFHRTATTHRIAPLDVGAVRELSVDGAAGPLRARLYEGPGSERVRPLIVFFHAGGFCIGDLDTHDDACRMLSHYAEARVLSVEYRLAPEHPFPAAFDDAFAAFRWARAHAHELGADPARLAVAGDSAGGQLAATVVQDCARAGEPQPAAQLAIYPSICRRVQRPSLGLFASGFFLEQRDIDTFLVHFASGLKNDDDVRLRPLDALEALPPITGKAIVATSGFDPLRDEGEAYAQTLRAHGVHVVARRFDGLTHGFANMLAVSGSSRKALITLAHDLQEALK